jgi:zinc transporter, ZIP family
VTNSLLTSVIYALIPSVVAVIATVVATFWSVGGAVRSALLHFAAGVVFAVVAVDLLPGIIQDQRPIWVVIGFTAGVVLMLLVRWLDKGGAPGNEDEQATRTAEKQAKGGRWPVSLLAGAAVDQVVSGLLLGISIAAGAKVGVLLTFAMTVEDLTFGLAIVAILAAAATRWQMIATNAGLGLLFTVVTVAAAAFLPAHSATLSTLILAFGSAALLFVVTEQLLVKAHKQPEAPLLAASFFVGFLLLLILDMIG